MLPVISKEDFEEILEGRKKEIAEDPTLSYYIYKIVYNLLNINFLNYHIYYRILKKY